jgi:paraquat-inducible protein A
MNNISIKKKWIINVILGLATFLFPIGIFAPIMTLNQFIFFSTEFSLATGLIDLLQEGHFILFIIVFLFSIIFPILKLATLLNIWFRKEIEIKKQQIRLYWLGVFGKWSMLDVFVVALLVVSVKLGALANVEIHYGLYVFATSVLLTMIATEQIRDLKELNHEMNPETTVSTATTPNSEYKD